MFEAVFFLGGNLFLFTFYFCGGGKVLHYLDKTFGGWGSLLKT